MKSVAILGGGLASLAAASKLTGLQATIFEKNSYLGGHAVSHVKDGFVFDEGPHVSFTRDEEIKKFLSGVVTDEFYELSAKILNYWKGQWIQHPVQTNLDLLPKKIREKCVKDFINKKQLGSDNYASWCRSNFGHSISEEFIFKYTRKYWRVEPESLATDWVGPRVYVPSVEEVNLGSKGPTNAHYITNFRYPKTGGFGSYLNFSIGSTEVQLNSEVRRIKKDGTWNITIGEKNLRFEQIISSLPLPTLISLIEDVPSFVVDESRKLLCTSIVLVNLGLKGSVKLPDAHWLYIYDEELPFARVHFPHTLSAANCPQGFCSLQAEVYYLNDERPLDALQSTVKGLIKANIIQSEEDIVFSDVLDVPFGNVVFDHNREKSLSVVNQFLDEIGIIRCGRYGDWGYYWTDDTIHSGWRAAAHCSSKSSLG